jgi:uncharacterized membrane protein
MTYTASPPPVRLPIIDALRGIALVAMAIYHFAWDLQFFDLIETDIVRHPFWKWFARGIAASFLTLVGISLVLATRHGTDRIAILKRLGMVGGAALLITIITFFATPQSYIFFGILHCIALGSVLGLAFLRLPTSLIAGLSALVLAMPLFVALPLLDQPLLRWIGMGTTLPFTNDYNPLFPWSGFILAGMVIGKRVLERGKSHSSAALPAPAAFLAKAGRHSLLVYLIHQPILIAIVAGMSLILPTISTDRATLDFRNSCAASCAVGGNTEVFCPRYCACAEENIRKEGLWHPIISAPLNSAQSTQIAAISQKCTTASRQ